MWYKLLWFFYGYNPTECLRRQEGVGCVEVAWSQYLQSAVLPAPKWRFCNFPLISDSALEFKSSAFCQFPLISVSFSSSAFQLLKWDSSSGLWGQKFHMTKMSLIHLSWHAFCKLSLIPRPKWWLCKWDQSRFREEWEGVITLYYYLYCGSS